VISISCTHEPGKGSAGRCTKTRPAAGRTREDPSGQTTAPSDRRWPSSRTILRVHRSVLWSAVATVLAILAGQGGLLGADRQIPEPPSCAVMDKIKEGRSLLAQSPRLRYVEQTITTKVKKVVKHKGRKKTITRVLAHKVLSRQEIALAVLDTTSCAVSERRYWLDTEDIARANQIRASFLDNPGDIPRFQPVDPSEDLEVYVRWWNTFNSDLSLRSRRGGPAETERYVVVANKYLVPNSRLAYASDQTGKTYSDIVYVPYSRSIHLEPLIEAGKAFLNEQVAAAFKDLKVREVESRAYPGLLVTDTMSESFIKNIFINEHSDPRWMLTAEDNGRWVAERYLIILGANGERAFRFTYSRTGALGIGQIMPETYAHIVDTYPEARLIRDIDIGRVEMRNAIKASILVFDDHLAVVINNIDKAPPGQRERNRELFEAKSEEEIEEIRAAIYNGGPGKYIPATGSISPRIQETVDFVRKFRLIRDLNLFE
jgi:hypothetical protein